MNGVRPLTRFESKSQIVSLDGLDCAGQLYMSGWHRFLSAVAELCASTYR